MLEGGWMEKTHTYICTYTRYLVMKPTDGPVHTDVIQQVTGTFLVTNKSHKGTVRTVDGGGRQSMGL